MINAVSERTLNTKTPEATQELFKEMAMNNYQWYNSRVKPSKPTHVYDMDAIIALTVQVKALHKKINKLSIIKHLALKI